MRDDVTRSGEGDKAMFMGMEPTLCAVDVL
jgi:hypothetical protein